MTISEWFPTVAGRRVNSAGGILGECVALVQKYANEVLGVSGAPAFPVPYARLMAGARSDAFTWIPNTPAGVPQYGDIVVFNGNVGGGAGHTGIAIEGTDTNQVRLIQQNDPTGSGASIKVYPYNNVSGWLHPKTNAAPPAQGGNDMIGNGENWYNRLNKEHVQKLGEEFPRKDFPWWVGKDLLNFVEATSDNPTAEKRAQVATVAIRDNWEGQINNLSKENKELKAQLAVQTDDTKLLNGFGEWLQKIITRLGVKK